MRDKLEMLKNNGLDWYVTTDTDDRVALKHASELSAILECGHDPADYGYAEIQQCWNGEDLSGDGWDG